MGLESGREVPQENPIFKLDRMECGELIEYQRDWLKKYIQSPRYREQLINEEQYTQKILKYQENADKLTSSKEVQQLISQTFGKDWELIADASTNYLGLLRGDFTYQIESLGWNCIKMSQNTIKLAQKLLSSGLSPREIETKLWSQVLKFQNQSNKFFGNLGMYQFYEIYYLIARQITSLLRSNNIDGVRLYCSNGKKFFTKLESIRDKSLGKTTTLKDKLSEFRTRDIEFEDEDFMVDTKVDNNMIKARINERLNALDSGYEIKFDVPASYTSGEYIGIGNDEDIVEYRNRDDEGVLNEEQGEMDNAFTPESGKTYFFKDLPNSILTPIHEFAHASVDATCLMSSYEIKQLMKYKVAQSNGISDESNSINDYHREIAEIYAHLTTLKFIMHETGITNVFEKEITKKDFYKLVEVYGSLSEDSVVRGEIFRELKYFIDVFGIGEIDNDGLYLNKEDEFYKNLIDCLNLIASNKGSTTSQQQLG